MPHIAYKYPWGRVFHRTSVRGFNYYKFYQQQIITCFWNGGEYCWNELLNNKYEVTGQCDCAKSKSSWQKQ